MSDGRRQAASFVLAGCLLFGTAEAVGQGLPTPVSCQDDVQGANDQPGQKDLTRFCADVGDGLPYDLHTSWNWDLTVLGGGNTADACSLYDNDADGNADLAVCVTVVDGGLPATLGEVRLFTCTDTDADRCTGSTQLNVCSGGITCLTDADCPGGETCAAQFQTLCSVSQQPTDPFPAGDSFPDDTEALCWIDLDDFGSGGVSARLLDACSYPSTVPNSDPSDCILFQGCTDAAQCDDGNPCTIDTCDVAGICRHTPDTGATCDDGAACTTSDTCSTQGFCSGTVVDCAGAGDQCNVASCDPAGADGNCDILTPVADGTACDNGACIVGETCGGGTCTGGGAPDCSGSGDACNTASCDPAGVEGNCDTLTPFADGTPCDNGACVVGETCGGGACTGGGPPDCSGLGGQCATASCDPLGAEGNCAILTPTNEGGSCDNGACSTGETCQSGACTGGGTPDCSGSGDACNAASCDPTGPEGNCDTLTPVADGTPCDNGACVVGETCGGGACTGGSAPDCSGVGGPCASASCDPAGSEGNCSVVTPTNEGDACDTGPCLVAETCQSGACAAGVPPDCSGVGGACNTASCDPLGAEGNCSTLTPVADGTACDNGVCVVGETCQGGACSGGGAPDCSAVGGPCTTASCDPAGIEGNCDTLAPAVDDTPCDDGDPCLVGEACLSGACTGGGPPDCSSAGGPCEAASCDPTGTEGNCLVLTLLSDGTPCSGAGICLSGGTCQGGSCTGGAPVDCSEAGDPCNTAACDSGGAPGNCDILTPVPDGAPCDENPCTIDQCISGTCDVVPIVDPTPPSDFVIVFDSSVSMKRDLKTWLPFELAGLPQAMTDAGIDWRVAIVRYATNRKPERPDRGPQVPDLLLDWTTDASLFQSTIASMADDIRRATESGSEAIEFALDNLQFRPNALRNIILYTDEDDDSPALDAQGQVNPERREPPAAGIKCFGKRCVQRWLPFQNRLDHVAARMIARQVQLNIVLQPRNRPVRSQYGDPSCTVLDADQQLDVTATVACLLTPDLRGRSPEGICGPGGFCTRGRTDLFCAVDADCDAHSLQLHLLTAGVCDTGAGVCTAGRVGSPCSDDPGCSLLARAYPIPRSAEDGESFFRTEFIPDKIREQACVAP